MSDQQKFEAVISDLVGVYSKDGTHIFMSILHDRYGISPRALEFFREQRRAATTSGDSIETVLEKCQKAWDTCYDTEELKKLWLCSYEPIEAMVNLYQRLRAGGIKLALLTNNVLGIVEHLDAVVAARFNGCGLTSQFEIVVASYFRGLRKPQEEIYREACEGIGVDPANVIFVDDKKENIPPAEQLGMTGNLFVNPQKLEADLRFMGLNFPARGALPPR